MGRGLLLTTLGEGPSDHGSRVDAFVRGAGVNLAGRVVGQALQFAAHIVMARIYGPAGFGLFALGWTIFRLGSFIAPLGLESGVMRFGSLSLSQGVRAVRQVAKDAMVLATIAGFLLGLALLLGARGIAGLFQEPDLTTILAVFAIGLPLAACMRVGVAATRVSQEMGYSVLAEYLLQPALFLSGVFLAHSMGVGVMGAVIAAVVSYGGAGALAVRFATRLFPASGGGSLERMVGRGALLKFSFPVALAGAFGLLVTWTDRLFVGYFMQAEAVGVYQAASQSALLFTVLTAATSTMLAPLIVDMHSRDDLEGVARLLGFSIRGSLMLSLPVLLVIALVPGELIHVLFGSDYVEGGPALRILILGQLIGVATGTAGFALVMIGRQRLWLWVSAAACLSNILLNSLLVPIFGLEGAALATTVSTGVLFVPPVLALRRILNAQIYPRETLRLIVPTIAAALIVWLVRGHLDMGAVGTVLALLPASALGFYLFAVPSVFTEDDRAYLRAIRHMIEARRGP
jgi:O-antigen/teichoic acid export membrane protein